MDEPQKIALVAEEITVAKRRVEGDTLKVRIETRFTDHLVELPYARENISIKTVEIGREVTAPPPIRIEGEVTIIPVMEEQFIVVKRLILAKELHITTRRTEGTVAETVQLRSEHAVIDRIPPSANNPLESTND